MPIEKLPALATSWVEEDSTADILSMIVDPFSWTKAGPDPNDAVLLRCGAGFVERSINSGSGWVDVTPLTNPSNDMVDTPAPTAAGVTYRQLDGSGFFTGMFIVLATWQNTSSEWRSWIALTVDDCVSWSWSYLGQDLGCPGETSGDECLNPTIIENDVPGDGYGPGNPSGQHSDLCIELDTNKFVLFMESPLVLFGPWVLFKIFEIEADGSVTWGADYEVGSWSGSVLKLTKVSTTKFAVLRWGDGPPSSFGENHQIVIFTFSGLTVTSHAVNDTRTDHEMSGDLEEPSYNQNEVDAQKAAAIFSDGTSIWIYAHTKLPVNPVTCDFFLTTYYNVSSLKGTISGNTITWDAGPDCIDPDLNPQATNAWTVVHTGIHTNVRFIAQIGSLNIDDGGHAIFFYQDYENDPGYPLTVWCFDGTTNGAKVTLTGTDTDQLSLKSPVDSRGSYNLIRLTDTLFIITLKVALWDDPPEYDDLPMALYCWAVSRSGTSLTCGPMFKAHEGFDVDNDILDFGAVRQSASEFFLVFYDDSICGTDPSTTLCISAKKFSVSTRTISLEEECYGWLDRRYLKQGTGSTRSMGLIVPTVRATDTDHVFINSGRDFRLGDDNVKSNYIDISDASFASCPEAGAVDAMGLGVSFGRKFSLRAWITMWEPTGLYLVDMVIPTQTVSSRKFLGAATEGEVVSKTWVAYPRVLWGMDDGVVVYGRMDAPQGLSSPEHIIYTVDGATSFQSLLNNWNSVYCGSVQVDPAGLIFAVKNNGASSQLYLGNLNGLALQSTLPHATGVLPDGMVVDWYDKAVFASARAAGAVMVALCPSPYSDWTDITLNHDNTVGVSSTIVL